MRIFGLRKKSKVVDETNRLLGRLEENPADTESRVKLADLYLEAGDHESAIWQYQTAAEQLSALGLDLESMTIYKRIFTLDGGSLGKRSLASFEKAEELLVKARKAYEKAFHIKLQEEASREASESLGRERRDGPEKVENLDTDGSEPIANEMLQAESHRQGVAEMPPDEISGGGSPEQKASVSGNLGSGSVDESDWEVRHEEADRSPDKAIEGGDVQEPVEEGQVTVGNDFLRRGEERQVDMSAIQMDDVLETMMSDNETAPFADNPLSADTTRVPSDEDLPATAPAFRQHDLGEKPSPLDKTETVMESLDREDPDLHYNLGIACFEMDLIDKAITEFVKAHNQGIRMVDSLFMLAKCYFKKGLFQNSAGFIYEALKLDNLTEDQIDMLQSQLQQIKARSNSTAPSPTKRSGS